MNRQQVKELLPIIQAFADGKQIEIKTKEGNRWCTLEENDIQYLDFKKCDFRIKPEPKYRPFNNAEECWTEMLKHQPFGWVLFLGDNAHLRFRTCVSTVYNTNVEFSDKPRYDFKDAFKNFKFTDDTPFGIKEKE